MKVLITGISQGIGKAISEKLSNEGHFVIGTTRNIQKIKDKIPGVQYLELDFRNTESINSLFQQVNEVDILINNAGIVQISPVEETPLNYYEEIFKVNFYGALHLIQHYAKIMRKKKTGLIINIGSLIDKYPLPYVSGYVASKSALSGFTWALRMEMKKYGVKVVSINPTDINTQMIPELIYNQGSVFEKDILKLAELERMNMDKAPSPEKVAGLVKKIMDKKNPKPVYTVGYMSGLLVLLKRLFNDRMIEKMIFGQLKL